MSLAPCRAMVWLIFVHVHCTPNLAAGTRFHVGEAVLSGKLNPTWARYKHSFPGTVLCSSLRTERACTCPSPKEWYRAGCGRSLGSCCRIVGLCGCCTLRVVAGVVRGNRVGGLCLAWMWMICGVSMFLSVRLAAVVSPGRLLMRLRVGILMFARPCARGGFCDASGAEACFLPGCCCAASLCSISCWY